MDKVSEAQMKGSYMEFSRAARSFLCCRECFEPNIGKAVKLIGDHFDFELGAFSRYPHLHLWVLWPVYRGELFLAALPFTVIRLFSEGTNLHRPLSIHHGGI